jgi:hypothetical protein
MKLPYWVILNKPYKISKESFNDSWMFHRTAPNRTNIPCQMITYIYMDGKMRLKEPKNENQEMDRATLCSDTKPNEIINTFLKPAICEAG